MTSMLRRAFVVAATVLALASGAGAQDWPAKPVRVVVAFTAGGTTDILARNIGQQLGERLKQPFVIDNMPAATSAPRWSCARRPTVTR
jgi:tripartite-type tricarboxylate transporter receptor subunit TctC